MLAGLATTNNLIILILIQSIIKANLLCTAHSYTTVSAFSESGSDLHDNLNFIVIRDKETDTERPRQSPSTYFSV